MAEFEYGGCVWPIDPACKTDKWEAFPDDVQQRALALASATLQRLTGGRVGGCPIKVRPQPSRGACFVLTGGFYGLDGAQFEPQIDNRGEWRNCGIAENQCAINLPAPVTRVLQVKIDGLVQEAADFQVENARTLVWMGTGDCPFPDTQNLRLDDSQPGTMSVTYLNTFPVDSIGSYAVGLLALEFAKACAGEKCALPAGTTSVTRSGVSIEIIAGSFPDGWTGIKQVDAFIALWNPRGLKQASTVWTPGQRTPLVTAGGPNVPPNFWDGGTP